MPPQDDAPMAPPAFPKQPPSALFAKLQSFLPVMEQENKKLEQALAEGDGAKHCIETDEDGAEQEQQAAGADADDKPQVIEMNFALGVMEEDEDDDASDDGSSDEDKSASGVDLKTSILAAAAAGERGAHARGGGDGDAAFGLKLSRESEKPRPMIQELN
ncbi:hypothetical protein PybrP1_010400 [[Pythium] brassicae (nom. inval.)]|nr:hypothetical protein PybrP1_010400 [[Pythium] brassicae (nom. inval.)]